MGNTLFFPFLGVFFVTKTDGNVDVWDLLDRYVIVTEIHRLRPIGHLHDDVVLYMYYDQNPSSATTTKIFVFVSEFF